MCTNRRRLQQPPAAALPGRSSCGTGGDRQAAAGARNAQPPRGSHILARSILVKLLAVLLLCKAGDGRAGAALAAAGWLLAGSGARGRLAPEQKRGANSVRIWIALDSSSCITLLRMPSRPRRRQLPLQDRNAYRASAPACRNRYARRSRGGVSWLERRNQVCLFASTLSLLSSSSHTRAHQSPSTPAAAIADSLLLCLRTRRCCRPKPKPNIFWRLWQLHTHALRASASER